MTVTPCQRAWAAGIVDADGCITIKKNRRRDGTVYYGLHVIVGQSGQTLPPVLARLQTIFGGYMESPNPDKRTDANRLPRWAWFVAHAQAEHFLLLILPHLVGKRDQAECALEYRKQGVGVGRKAIAAQFYEKLHSFKNYTRRGK